MNALLMLWMGAAEPPAELPAESFIGLPTTVQTQAVQDERGVGVEMSFAVAAEPEVVIAALWADDNFQAVFPSVVASSVLSETETTKTLQLTERYMGIETSYVLVLSREPGKLSYVQGPEERTKMAGEIVASPLGQGASRVTYTGTADMGWMVPDKMMIQAMQDMAPQIAANLRALVAS
ncbi:MAG: SRPBCC family protein [Myxococcota bacterium]|nr:SRPBCC family protein [Myxococcota bacterium]